LFDLSRAKSGLDPIFFLFFSIFEIAEVAASESDPIDDNRGSAEYKREMVTVLVRRAAKEALQRI